MTIDPPSILPATPSSDAFSQVIALWSRDRATLGPMPEGAFVDAAQSGGLLLARGHNEIPLGYVMYRCTKQRTATIAHLCVGAGHRGCGVARSLFDAVRSRVSHCFEIRVTCRRDFAANSLWHKLGFVALGEKPGRAKDSVLTLWRYELSPLPLFRVLESEADAQSSAVRAVIDANVFFDLDDESPPRDESKALLADWLVESLELAVTQELHNEINRRADPNDRERQRARARRFSSVLRDIKREEAVLSAIRERLPKSSKPSGLSDARQLAMTIAGNVTFFVTRDEEVLDIGDWLYDSFGLRAMAPHEIICRFDELRREDDYRPRRMFLGPDVRTSLARADQAQRLAELLHTGNSAPEPFLRTLGRLRVMLAQPERFQAVCIQKGEELLASYFLDRSGRSELLVPFFAVSGTPLGRTAARHYAQDLLRTAASESRTVVRVENVGARVADALADLGFMSNGDSWLKLCLSVALPPDSLCAEVQNAADAAPHVLPLAQRAIASLRALAPGGSDRVAAAGMAERALWPAKVLGVGLPCSLVSIRPVWAKELFDHALAERTLFGADPGLSLNIENVYYRAAAPGRVVAPSRVLWYVSDDPGYPHSKALRACSIVDEVLVGRPKDLFRRFRRLGVYEWSDLCELTENNPDVDIMAFRFSCTELLSSPVPWSTIQEVLRRHTGKGNPLLSPLTMSEDCFMDLYCRGMQRR